MVNVHPLPPFCKVVIPCQIVFHITSSKNWIENMSWKQHWVGGRRGGGWEGGCGSGHICPKTSMGYFWRASCKKVVSDFLGQIFVLVQMRSIFACDLGLNGKTLPRNFFCCFVFRFQEIFLNQHWQQMRVPLILLLGKTKAFFGKDTARKKTAFLHTLFMVKERETSKLK